jgi:hypothetical protein
MAAAAQSTGQIGRGEQPLAAVHRYFEISLFLLITTGVCTLISTGILDLLSVVFALLALGIKAGRYWRGHGPEISANAAKWLTIAYFLFFPFDLWIFSRALASGSPSPALFAALLAAIHLLLFAMVVRLFSATTTRDYLFLAMLAFSMMLVAAILTVDTWFLVLFFIFLMLATSTFLGLEIRRSAEGAVAPPLARGTPMAQRLTQALGTTSISVALGSLLLGTGIFFILPRFTAGYLSGFNLQPTLISGFDDNVQLGRIGIIKKSTEVVMRVRLEEGSGLPATAKWRGVALTKFDGSNWFREPTPEITATPDLQGWHYVGYALGDLSREEWQGIAKDKKRMEEFRREMGRRRQLRYKVLLEPLATDTLFLTSQARAVRGQFAPGANRPGRRGSYVLVDEYGNVRNPYHLYSRILYDAWSVAPNFSPEALRHFGIPYSEKIRQRYLQLPPLDPRISQLAQQATRDAPTAYDKAAAIETYLRTQFGYTLELPSPMPADPIAHFLFERRKGHCEYFASAMTVMLRSLGIPSRLVNGFLPGEFNDVGEDYIVRGSDAHSWVEVYFGEYGWIEFDPTPPADARTGGLWDRLGLYYDWMQLMWSEWIINYDLNHQLSLGQNLIKGATDASTQTRAWFYEKRRAAIQWMKSFDLAEFFVNFWPWAIVLAGLIASFVMVRKKSLMEYLAAEWGLHFGGEEVLSPRVATLQYQKMLRLLARRGWEKSPAQTPLEFAASLPAVGIAPPVSEFTRLYQSARFGAYAADVRRMSEILASLKLMVRNS